LHIDTLLLLTQTTHHGILGVGLYARSASAISSQG